MIERIDGAPDGVTALRADGEVSADDYRQVLEPALREAAESGSIRLLYVLGPDFAMQPAAMAQDAKVGLEFGIGHHSAWERTAIVTDSEWVARSIAAFAWMVPGEIHVFKLGEEDAARTWVAA
ncbi:MAG: STAS/SEC14 domain-containing protein [Actinobacteria bacterium]|nr:STAS/SEC14 domain-containing protein [Actinomycetota bacterium]